MLGGAAGLALAWCGADVLAALLGIENEVPVNSTVLAFTAAASGLAGVLLGVAPAYAGSRLLLTGWLKGAAVIGGGNSRWGLRGAFVMAQVALCLPALIAAGLLLRSLENLYAVDTGFDSARVVQGDIDTRGNGYALERSRTLLDDLLARISLRPGIRSAAMGQGGSFSGWTSSRRLSRERDDESLSTNYSYVSPRYFETLGVPLLAGRDFDGNDTAESPKVALVSKDLAGRLFGGASPLGRGVSFQTNGPFDITIVGVVADTKHDSLRRDPGGMLYLPLSQHEFAQVTVYLQTAGGVDAAQVLTQELEAIDPQLPAFRIQTLGDRIDRSLRNERSLAGLLSGFSALGLALAAIGLYGVMSYAVSRRTREFGLRKALGARQTHLAALVLRGGSLWIAAGVVLGLGAAAAVTRLIERALFGIEPVDPPTYVLGAGFLLLVALIAALKPTLRASRVEPMQALRYE